MIQRKKYSQRRVVLEDLLNHPLRWIFLNVNNRTSHIAKQECLQLDVGDVVSNLFESKAAGVTNFSFGGHCAMTNADEANEVQEKVITEKKGQKRGIKSITSFQGILRPYL